MPGVTTRVVSLYNAHIEASSLLQFSEVITNAKAHSDLFLNPSTNVKSIAFICALNYRFK